MGSMVVFALVVGSASWLKPMENHPRASVWSADLAASEVGGVGESESVTFVEEVAAMANHSEAHPGEPYFLQFCASCHGMVGTARVPGMVGSDLFDGISERQMTRESMTQILKEGILEQGMLPMAAVLSEAQLSQVVDYLVAHQP